MEDFNLNPTDKAHVLKQESSELEFSDGRPFSGRASAKSATGVNQSELCSFVESHYERTYAYCYRLSGRRSDAEDLCQQVFVAAIKNLGQIRSLESAQAWLATTARRLYWHSLKESARHKTLPNSQVCEPETHYEPCENNLERVDWVHHALNQLNPLARIMVVMFYFEDKSYQQISQELDVPMGTVMSRLSRSKDMLREALLKTAEPLAVAKAR